MHAPGCETKELVRLMWLHKSGEPPGDPNHNIAYDHDLIEICPACNGATLEALRHDCFDFEDVWDQYEWYELPPADGAKLRIIAARCERPLDPSCNCAAHKSLRTSAHALPRSSWNAVFETVAHRHVITVGDGAKPEFRLAPELADLLRVADERSQPLAPPTVVQPKAPDSAAVGFVFLAWPALLAVTLYGWFRLVHVPWYVDAVAVIVAMPVTFVVAGMLLAARKVIKDNSNK